MGPPKVVLFDLGGVLLPFDRERRVAAMVADLGVSADAARAFMASDLHHRLDVGAAGVTDLAHGLTALAGRPVDEARAVRLILSVFGPPNLALWEAAARLRRRLPVGGFSDNPAFVARLFPDGAVLAPMFWSAELGLSKADARAFAAVERALNVDPGRILFIDDSPGNVALARDLGWDAIHHRTNGLTMGELADRGLE